MRHDPTTVAVAAGLGIIGLVSLPALTTFTLRLTTREPRQDSYEDEDGKATPESLKAYSSKLPKSLIVLFAALGSATAIATAVLATLDIGKDGLFLDNWLSAAASVSPPCFHVVYPVQPLTRSIRIRYCFCFRAQPLLRATTRSGPTISASTCFSRLSFWQ